MKLFVDHGNSFAKWWLEGKDGALVGVGRDRAPGYRCLIDALSCRGGEILSVYLANVAGASVGQALRALARTHCPLASWCEFKVQRSCLGVSVAYEDLSTLGVDRWLAMIAANHDYSGAKLVVSLGTAVTVDKIDRGGKHLGGLIAPGWPMLSRAVAKGSADISVMPAELRFDGSLGVSTSSCVELGVSMMILSFIDRAIEKFGAGAGCTTILSGGDALVVSRQLPDDIVLRETLVLEGMRLVSACDKGADHSSVMENGSE